MIRWQRHRSRSDRILAAGGLGREVWRRADSQRRQDGAPIRRPLLGEAGFSRFLPNVNTRRHETGAQKFQSSPPSRIRMTCSIHGVCLSRNDRILRAGPRSRRVPAAFGCVELAGVGYGAIQSYKDSVYRAAPPGRSPRATGASLRWANRPRSSASQARQRTWSMRTGRLRASGSPTNPGDPRKRGRAVFQGSPDPVPCDGSGHAVQGMGPHAKPSVSIPACVVLLRAAVQWR
jgi:hypothetical protein